MNKWVSKAALVTFIAIFGFTLVVRQVFASTKVTPSNLGIWSYQVSNTGSVVFDNTAKVGLGSVRLFSGSQGNSFAAITSTNFVGTDLNQITKFDFSTFGKTGTPNSPKVDLDINTQCGPDRLTFKPENQNAGAQQNVWQDWVGLNGVWASSLFPNSFNSGTISQYSAFIQQPQACNSSNATIINRPDSSGGLRFDIGPGSSSDVFDGNVDNFTIGISGSDTTYDFDPDSATNTMSQQYYSDTNFQTPQGSPSALPGNVLNKNWGTNPPASGVGPDNWSARWEGTYDFISQVYRLTANSNGTDSVKIYVDGNIILNKPGAGAAQALFDARNSVGVHTVRIDYVHNTGSARVAANFWDRTKCYDMDANNVINSTDLQQDSFHFGATGMSPWDMPDSQGNFNNNVNATDLLNLSQKFGKTCGPNF